MLSEDGGHTVEDIDCRRRDAMICSCKSNEHNSALQKTAVAFTSRTNCQIFQEIYETDGDQRGEQLHKIYYGHFKSCTTKALLKLFLPILLVADDQICIFR